MEKILDVIYDYKTKIPDEKFYNYILDILLDKDEKNKFFVKRKIKEKGRNTAIFYPTLNTICLSKTSIDNWVLENVNSFNTDNIDEDLFSKFMYAFVVIHEIMHSKQYLISTKKIKSNYSFLYEIYKDIYSVIEGNSEGIILNYLKLIRKIIYKFNENYLILERNANMEATKLLYEISTLDSSCNNISCIFKNLYNSFSLIGYQNDKSGCIKNTYDKLFMNTKYKKINFDLENYEDKIRYGVKLSDDEYIKVKKLSNNLK